MAGPGGKMSKSAGCSVLRTEFSLEVAEEKGGSRGDEPDDVGHVGV
jgi:hypothetical protein